jgi:ORF6N domain
MDIEIIPAERIAQSILYLRGQKVMLDYNLASLYGIETRALKQAARRNRGRFPDDFMFELSTKEVETLVSQFVIPSVRKFGEARPMAFTEQGVAMLSSVLHSARAVKVNIAIMRAFVRLREALETNRELARKFSELEKRVGERTRLACRRWRPRHRELPLPGAAAHGIRRRRSFSAGRRKQHARGVCSPIQSP